MSSKKIEAAVRKVTDKYNRSRSVIIYGVKEKDSELLQDTIEEVHEKIGEKPLVTDCLRVGTKKSCDTLPRPIKFTPHNSDHVVQVFRNAKQLQNIEGYKSVYICPDRTVQERKAYTKLLETLKDKRKSEPGREHFIKNIRIVSSDKNG